MPDLSTPVGTLTPRAKRRFGQHFLHHRVILERIVDALDPPHGALVLEIGPGQGALTAVLVARGARVTAIEKDRELAPLVVERVPGARVVVGDALRLDWRQTAGAAQGEPLLVTGNIPYNITSPLLARALEPPRPERIVFLVQQEVAERLAASPDTRAYGALSVGVQAVARVEKLFRVPAGAFHPPPKVDSALVRLTPLQDPLIADPEAAAFRQLVVGLFGLRRKQLMRGLREHTGLSPEAVAEVLGRVGIPGDRRPENVSAAAFARLLRALPRG